MGMGRDHVHLKALSLQFILSLSGTTKSMLNQTMMHRRVARGCTWSLTRGVYADLFPVSCFWSKMSILILKTFMSNFDCPPDGPVIHTSPMAVHNDTFSIPPYHTSKSCLQTCQHAVKLHVSKLNKYSSRRRLNPIEQEDSRSKPCWTNTSDTSDTTNPTKASAKQELSLSHAQPPAAASLPTY